MAGMPNGKSYSAWATGFFLSGAHNPKGRTSPEVQKETVRTPEGSFRLKFGLKVWTEVPLSLSVRITAALFRFLSAP